MKKAAAGSRWSAWFWLCVCVTCMCLLRIWFSCTYGIWTNTKRIWHKVLFSPLFYFHFIYCEHDWMCLVGVYFAALNVSRKKFRNKRCCRPQTAYILLIPRSHTGHRQLTIYLPSYHPDENPFESFSNSILNSDFDYLLLLVMPSATVSLTLEWLRRKCVWNIWRRGKIHKINERLIARQVWQADSQNENFHRYRSYSCQTKN